MKKIGLIVSNISNLYQVEIDNKIYTCSARGKLKQEGITPLVGDKVEIEITDKEKEEGIINTVIERKNYCKRPKMANLTQIIFVVSVKMPKPDLLLLDKQLAFAEWLKVKPIIILNKIDLEKEEKVKKIEEIYTNIGYKVIKTNAKSIGKEELNTIKEILKNNITAFSGNSGVGKSTLINAIFSNELTKEGIISQKNKKGKNTTTSVTLYKLAENEYVADTPGFSTFDITEITKDELCHYFKEFENELVNCKYIGCSHIKEQECGIKKALEEGKIENVRYENYCKIYEKLKEEEEHKW